MHQIATRMRQVSPLTIDSSGGPTEKILSSSMASPSKDRQQPLLPVLNGPSGHRCRSLTDILKNQRSLKLVLAVFFAFTFVLVVVFMDSSNSKAFVRTKDLKSLGLDVVGDAMPDAEHGHIIVKHLESVDSQDKSEEINDKRLDTAQEEESDDDDENDDSNNDEDGDTHENLKSEENTQASTARSSRGQNGQLVVGSEADGGWFDGFGLRLTTQIKLPSRPIFQNYNVKENYTPVYGSLKKRGWVQGREAVRSKVNMFLTRGTVVLGLDEKRQIQNTIGLSGCMGGNKQLQLACRKNLAKAHGCEYSSLGIQPAQFNMEDKQECERFFEYAAKSENIGKRWMSKPVKTFHGSGIQVYANAEELKKQNGGSCRATYKHKFIAMEYVSQPATIRGGYKFDFRTYMLVGSLTPQLVFYHDGYVRKSDQIYDADSKNRRAHITNTVGQGLKDHYYTFDEVNRLLELEMGFKPNTMERLRPRMMEITRYVFSTSKTQATPLRRKFGRWHVFGLDWIIDAQGRVHLLEGNGYPLISLKDLGRGLDKDIFDTMTDLVVKLHTEPEKLGPPERLTVASGFKHGGWSLVHSELEEVWQEKNGKTYNPCETFKEEQEMGKYSGK